MDRTLTLVSDLLEFTDFGDYRGIYWDNGNHAEITWGVVRRPAPKTYSAETIQVETVRNGHRSNFGIFVGYIKAVY